MNREEFCELLAKAKEQSGIKTSDISFQMKMLFPSLRRFEKGIHNFKVDKAIEYVSTIKSILVLANKKKKVYIKSYEDIPKFIKKTRNNIYSQYSLAKVINRDPTTITYIESRKTVCSIDTFLRILEALEYEITIEPIK